MANDKSQTDPCLYGLQPRWITRDRLYRVYVSEKMLAGAYVAGQVYDEPSAAIIFREWSLLLRPLIRRWLVKRLERETLYDSLEPYGSSLLEQDPRNFRILRSEVARTRFRRNRSLWTRFNVGVVELQLLAGVKRRFILVGDQPQDAIMQLMLEFDPQMEVIGKPNPLPKPKPMSPAGQRWLFSAIGLVFVAYGGFFAYRAMTHVPPAPEFFLFAILNGIVAISCFVTAWRVSGEKPKADADGGPDRTTANDPGGEANGR